jgi:hypothetical protein
MDPRIFISAIDQTNVEWRVEKLPGGHPMDQ